MNTSILRHQLKTDLSQTRYMINHIQISHCFYVQLTMSKPNLCYWQMLCVEISLPKYDTVRK